MKVANDPRPIIEAPNNLQAAARSRMYALLAEAFAYPQGDAVLRLLDGDWEAEVVAAISDSGLSVGSNFSLRLPDRPSAITELQVSYTELFDVAGGTPKVSLLERRYVDTPEQELWSEVLGFYGHFGLDFSQGYANEQPDHLLTELAFMHYLSFLEAGTLSERDSFRRGQRDFLQLHLAHVGNGCAEKISSIGQAEPYASIAALMAELITADLEYLNQRPGVTDRGSPEFGDRRRTS